jgi:hypothetical protein
MKAETSIRIITKDIMMITGIVGNIVTPMD